MKKYKSFFLAIAMTAFTACRNETSKAHQESKMVNKVKQMAPNMGIAH
ncbi:MAG: hypothetical protein ACJAT1_000829 [Marivirga sp.]|jgi:hypothetical protein